MRTYILFGILAVAVILGAVGSVMSSRYIEAKTKSVATILVAAESLAAGTELGEKQIKSVNVPNIEVKDFDKFVALCITEGNRTSVIGQTLAREVPAGQPLMRADFDPFTVKRQVYEQLTPTDDEKRKGLTFRAITIPVNLDSSVANILEPGDHVDIIGTYLADMARAKVERVPQERNRASAEEGAVPTAAEALADAVRASQESSEKAIGMDVTTKEVGYVTRTLLQNVRVIGVGQKFTTPEESLSGPDQMKYNTVTLRMTPTQAQVVAFAQHVGSRMTLVLRAPDDAAPSDAESMNFRAFDDYVQRQSMPVDELPAGFVVPIPSGADPELSSQLDKGLDPTETLSSESVNTRSTSNSRPAIGAPSDEQDQGVDEATNPEVEESSGIDEARSILNPSSSTKSSQ